MVINSVSVYNNNLNDECVIISLFDGKNESRFRYLDKYKIYSIPAYGWNIFNNVDFYVDKIKEIIHNLNSPKKVLFIGICKHSNLILECAFRLYDKFPNIKFGVLGAPWCYDCDKNVSPLFNGNNLSDELNVIIKNNHPVSLIEKLKYYGNASNIFNKYKDIIKSKKIKIFQYVPFNENWELDFLNKDRFNSFSDEFIVQVNESWDYKTVHSSIVFFVKIKELINFIDSCFCKI